MIKNIIYLVSFSLVTLAITVKADNIIDINEQIPSGGTDTTCISGFNFYNKEVVYDNKNGLAILEGDILLGSVEEANSYKTALKSKIYSGGTTQQSVFITGQKLRWVNNVIPFQFGTNVSDRTRNMMLDAMDH